MDNSQPGTSVAGGSASTTHRESTLKRRQQGKASKSGTQSSNISVCSGSFGNDQLRTRPSVSSIESINSFRSSNVSYGYSNGVHDTRFPKLSECAHFHYDPALVEIGTVTIDIEFPESIYDETPGGSDDHSVSATILFDPMNSSESIFSLRISASGRQPHQAPWTVRHSYESVLEFDEQLHRCVYDRRTSHLAQIPPIDEARRISKQDIYHSLSMYFKRFSEIAGSLVTCAPVLNWLELDNRGRHLVASMDNSAINMPGVGAAHVVQSYQAEASDELTLKVGDIISVIDMPSASESIWWRGKREFEVGLFPYHCVELIDSPKSLPPAANNIENKPVFHRRGKLASFFLGFLMNRPTRRDLKRRGILKERVFGCDLAEYLQNVGLDVPSVLRSCCSVLESHGIVDGIYRLSGIVSNIQKLRNAFDEQNEPNLLEERYLQDIHCIASLVKMYFRELPNPLFTYQLYPKFVEAVDGTNSSMKILRLHDVVQQLPPPHYRTAEFLIRHLARVAEHGHKTGMHFQNLAIVWAPNLLRCRALEGATECAGTMLHDVNIQAIITEYLIRYADMIFNHKMPTLIRRTNTSENDRTFKPRRASRPSSMAVSTPTKLLNIAEAQEKMLAAREMKIPPNVGLPDLRNRKCIDVNGGPAALPPKYHTVIDWPQKGSRNDRSSSHVPFKRFLFRGSGRVEQPEPQQRPMKRPAPRHREDARLQQSSSEVASDIGGKSGGSVTSGTSSARHRYSLKQQHSHQPSSELPKIKESMDIMTASVGEGQLPCIAERPAATIDRKTRNGSDRRTRLRSVRSAESLLSSITSNPDGSRLGGHQPNAPIAMDEKLSSDLSNSELNKDSQQDRRWRRQQEQRRSQRHQNQDDHHQHPMSSSLHHDPYESEPSLASPPPDADQSGLSSTASNYYFRRQPSQHRFCDPGAEGFYSTDQPVSPPIPVGGTNYYSDTEQMCATAYPSSANAATADHNRYNHDGAFQQGLTESQSSFAIFPGAKDGRRLHQDNNIERSSDLLRQQISPPIEQHRAPNRTHEETTLPGPPYSTAPLPAQQRNLGGRMREAIMPPEPETEHRPTPPKYQDAVSRHGRSASSRQHNHPEYKNIGEDAEFSDSAAGDSDAIMVVSFDRRLAQSDWDVHRTTPTTFGKSPQDNTTAQLLLNRPSPSWNCKEEVPPTTFGQQPPSARQSHGVSKEGTPSQGYRPSSRHQYSSDDRFHSDHRDVANTPSSSSNQGSVRGHNRSNSSISRFTGQQAAQRILEQQQHKCVTKPEERRNDQQYECVLETDLDKVMDETNSYSRTHNIAVRSSAGANTSNKPTTTSPPGVRAMYETSLVNSSPSSQRRGVHNAEHHKRPMDGQHYSNQHETDQNETLATTDSTIQAIIFGDHALTKRRLSAPGSEPPPTSVSKYCIDDGPGFVTSATMLHDDSRHDTTDIPDTIEPPARRTSPGDAYSYGIYTKASPTDEFALLRKAENTGRPIGLMTRSSHRQQRPSQEPQEYDTANPRSNKAAHRAASENIRSKLVQQPSPDHQLRYGIGIYSDHADELYANEEAVSPVLDNRLVVNVNRVLTNTTEANISPSRNIIELSPSQPAEAAVTLPGGERSYSYQAARDSVEVIDDPATPNNYDDSADDIVFNFDGPSERIVSRGITDDRMVESSVNVGKSAYSPNSEQTRFGGERTVTENYHGYAVHRRRTDDADHSTTVVEDEQELLNRLSACVATNRPITDDNLTNQPHVALDRSELNSPTKDDIRQFLPEMETVYPHLRQSLADTSMKRQQIDERNNSGIHRDLAALPDVDHNPSGGSYEIKPRNPSDPSMSNQTMSSTRISIGLPHGPREHLPLTSPSIPDQRELQEAESLLAEIADSRYGSDPEVVPLVHDDVIGVTRRTDGHHDLLTKTPSFGDNDSVKRSSCSSGTVGFPQANSLLDAATASFSEAEQQDVEDRPNSPTDGYDGQYGSTGHGGSRVSEMTRILSQDGSKSTVINSKFVKGLDSNKEGRKLRGSVYDNLSDGASADDDVQSGDNGDTESSPQASYNPSQNQEHGILPLKHRRPFPVDLPPDPTPKKATAVTSARIRSSMSPLLANSQPISSVHGYPADREVCVSPRAGSVAPLNDRDQREEKTHADAGSHGRRSDTSFLKGTNASRTPQNRSLAADSGTSDDEQFPVHKTFPGAVPPPTFPGSSTSNASSSFVNSSSNPTSAKLKSTSNLLPNYRPLMDRSNPSFSSGSRPALPNKPKPALPVRKPDAMTASLQSKDGPIVPRSGRDSSLDDAGRHTSDHHKAVPILPRTAPPHPDEDHGSLASTQQILSSTPPNSIGAHLSVRSDDLGEPGATKNELANSPLFRKQAQRASQRVTPGGKAIAGSGRKGGSVVNKTSTTTTVKGSSSGSRPQSSPPAPPISLVERSQSEPPDNVLADKLKIASGYPASLPHKSVFQPRTQRAPSSVSAALGKSTNLSTRIEPELATALAIRKEKCGTGASPDHKHPAYKRDSTTNVATKSQLHDLSPTGQQVASPIGTNRNLQMYFV